MNVNMTSMGAHRFLEHGLTVHPFLRYNLQGELVGKAEVQHAEWTSLYEKFGKRPLLLGWHEIRQLLFEYLPEGTVEFDKQVRPSSAVESRIVLPRSLICLSYRSCLADSSLFSMHKSHCAFQQTLNCILVEMCDLVKCSTLQQINLV